MQSKKRTLTLTFQECQIQQWNDHMASTLLDIPASCFTRCRTCHWTLLHAFFLVHRLSSDGLLPQCLFLSRPILDWSVKLCETHGGVADTLNLHFPHNYGDEFLYWTSVTASFMFGPVFQDTDSLPEPGTVHPEEWKASRTDLKLRHSPTAEHLITIRKKRGPPEMSFEHEVFINEARDSYFDRRTFSLAPLAEDEAWHQAWTWRLEFYTHFEECFWIMRKHFFSLALAWCLPSLSEMNAEKNLFWILVPLCVWGAERSWHQKNWIKGWVVREYDAQKRRLVSPSLKLVAFVAGTLRVKLSCEKHSFHFPQQYFSFVFERGFRKFLFWIRVSDILVWVTSLRAVCSGPQRRDRKRKRVWSKPCCISYSVRIAQPRLWFFWTHSFHILWD